MAVKGKITNLDTVSELFKGKGDIVLFDALNLSSGTLAALTGAKSLGDIKLDSTTWTGDAPTETLVKNEQNEVVTSSTVAGTFGFEFTVLSTSTSMMQKLMAAGIITQTFVAGDTFLPSSVVLGFGTSLPVVECPIAVMNESLNKTIIYPNGKITSSLAMDGGVTCIKCKVTAQKVDTATLKTVMIVTNASAATTVNYTTDPA